MTTLPSAARQRGATLVVSLIMLVILTLFAVSGFNMSSINLRITGNYQNQRMMDQVVQQAVEQVISSTGTFTAPATSTICVNGSGGYCTGGFNVSIGAATCKYTTTATGYTKKVGELTPEDTDWEFRAEATDSLSGAKSAIVQGVRVRMLAGNCP